MAPGHFFDRHFFDRHIFHGHIINRHIFFQYIKVCTYFRPVLKMSLKTLNKFKWPFIMIKRIQNKMFIFGFALFGFITLGLGRLG